MKKLKFLALMMLLAANAWAAESISLLKTNSSWNGQQYPAVNLQNPEVNVLKITISAGEKLAMHQHSMINIAYVLQGVLTVHTENGDVITIKAGDVLPEVVNTWHYGENNGTEDVILVVTYVGEKDAPLSISKN